MSDGGREDGRRDIRFRLNPSGGWLGFLGSAIVTVLLWSDGLGADANAFRRPTFALVCGAIVCGYFAFCMVRDSLHHRFVVMEAKTISIPREFIGLPRVVSYADIEALEVRKGLFVRTLRIGTGRSKVRVLSTWLPPTENLEWLRDEIARRVEIATGRKLD